MATFKQAPWSWRSALGDGNRVSALVKGQRPGLDKTSQEALSSPGTNEWKVLGLRQTHPTELYDGNENSQQATLPF